MDEGNISSAEHSPEHCLRILRAARHSFSQYLQLFLPVPAACVRLGNILSDFDRGIRRFTSRYNTSNETHAVFCRLTLGLPEDLTALEFGLRSCVHDYGSNSIASRHTPLALDIEWIEDILSRFKHISTAIDIINESLERAQSESFGIRTSGTIQDIHKRVEESLHTSSGLEILMNNFLHGISAQTRIQYADGQDLPTFTSANISHREIGQNIAAKLKEHTRDAIKTKVVGEDLLSWKIRRSIYWYSRGADHLSEWKSENGLAISYNSLPSSHRAWRTIATYFVDALKATWLLNDLGCLQAYKEPSFETREIVFGAKRKVLALLRSFYNLTTPRYVLIAEFGDFDVRMFEERSKVASEQRSASNSFYSSSNSGLGSTHSMSSNSTPPAELEARILNKLPSDEDPPAALTKRPCALNTPKERVLLNHTCGARATITPGSIDGLHLTNLEDPNASQSEEELSERFRGVELHNLEIEHQERAWTGFQRRVSSIDVSPPHNNVHSQSQVHVFQSESEAIEYLRLITYRKDLPTDRRDIQRRTAQLVPVYCFVEDRSDSSELYISDSGMQSSLRYRFQCREPDGTYHPWELYGFQGALMGAYFEGDYIATSILLHRRGSAIKESERFPRLQVWTDFPSGPYSPASAMSTTESSKSASSPISEKDFSALTSRLTNNVSDSKIFIFSKNFIYVLFVSDRISLIRPRKGLSKGKAQKSRVCFVPNKHSGNSSIRVRTLKGTRDKPAGIPLDQSGLRYADQQQTELFDDYQSIEIEFDFDQDAEKFLAHFQEYVAEWKQRCVPVDNFRELQRNRTITVSSTTTFESGIRRQKTA